MKAQGEKLNKTLLSVDILIKTDTLRLNSITHLCKLHLHRYLHLNTQSSYILGTGGT